MKTLQDVKDRCIIVPGDDSDDGCEHWIFKGARIYAPDYTLDRLGGAMLIQRPRRAVRHIVTGRSIPAGWRVWSSCLMPQCVCPACLACGSVQAYGRARAKSGIDRGRIARILANRRNSSGQRKVTREMAEMILASRDSAHTLSLQFGLDESTIRKVWKGRSQAAPNPFQGLGSL